MNTESITRQVIQQLLGAIESRDLRAVRRALHPDATWQNVPHAPYQSRDAIMLLLHPILCWSDRVQWDVLSSSVEGVTGWYERLDRFWLAGAEHAVSCNGVLTIDPETQTVLSVRDYVDLGEWRDRVNPTLGDLASQPAQAVVARHLDALRSGDPIRMSADYSLDAVLARPNARFEGWYAIADYYDAVSSGPDAQSLTFGRIESLKSDIVRVRWHRTQDSADLVSGADTFTVYGGRISHQHTELS